MRRQPRTQWDRKNPAVVACPFYHRRVRIQPVLTSHWTKAAVFVACMVPAALLYWRWAHHLLGPNWIEKAQHFTGDWILRFLIFTLCVSPLRKLPGLSALIRYRRMLGLFAFFYACVHFGIYLWFDKGLDWTEMYGDFTQRRFYIFGLVAFVALIPLALTSTAGWIRRLGGRRWQWLHRLIYVSALAGALHYYLQGKSIVLRAVYYGLVMIALVLWRVPTWIRKAAHQ
jgi:sulfoxide reductase heme-binding subunit YedZ